MRTGLWRRVARATARFVARVRDPEDSREGLTGSQTKTLLTLAVVGVVGAMASYRAWAFDSTAFSLVLLNLDGLIWFMTPILIKDSWSAVLAGAIQGVALQLIALPMAPKERLEIMGHVPIWASEFAFVLIGLVLIICGTIAMIASRNGWAVLATPWILSTWLGVTVLNASVLGDALGTGV